MQPEEVNLTKALKQVWTIILILVSLIIGAGLILAIAIGIWRGLFG